MNYQLIYSEGVVSDFIHTLPALSEHERFYMTIMARRKYAPDILPSTKTDRKHIARYIVRPNQILDKLKLHEIKLGAYKTKEGIEIPNEALACYIMPNPRDMRKAMFNLASRIVQAASNNTDLDITIESVTEVHKSASKKVFSIWDFDMPEDMNRQEFTENTLRSVEEITGLTGKSYYINTRGGMHVIINPKNIPKSKAKTWYNELQKIENFNLCGDLLVPIPGTIQGGHNVTFNHYAISR